MQAKQETNTVDNDEATKQFRQMLMEFSANMAGREQEYTKKTISAVLQQQKMSMEIQQMQQSIL